MANMSYCRFENTVRDLRDCQEAMDDTELSKSEARYRIRLVQLCMAISNEYADYIEEWEKEAKSD